MTRSEIRLIPDKPSLRHLWGKYIHFVFFGDSDHNAVVVCDHQKIKKMTKVISFPERYISYWEKNQKFCPVSYRANLAKTLMSLPKNKRTFALNSAKDFLLYKISTAFNKAVRIYTISRKVGLSLGPGSLYYQGETQELRSWLSVVLPNTSHYETYYKIKSLYSEAQKNIQSFFDSNWSQLKDTHNLKAFEALDYDDDNDNWEWPPHYHLNYSDPKFWGHYVWVKTPDKRVCTVTVYLQKELHGNPMDASGSRGTEFQVSVNLPELEKNLAIRLELENKKPFEKNSKTFRDIYEKLKQIITPLSDEERRELFSRQTSLCVYRGENNFYKFIEVEPLYKVYALYKDFITFKPSRPMRVMKPTQTRTVCGKKMGSHHVASYKITYTLEIHQELLRGLK